jgi:hypothetical protein
VTRRCVGPARRTRDEQCDDYTSVMSCTAVHMYGVVSPVDHLLLGCMYHSGLLPSLHAALTILSTTRRSHVACATQATGENGADRLPQTLTELNDRGKESSGDYHSPVLFAPLYRPGHRRRACMRSTRPRLIRACSPWPARRRWLHRSSGCCGSLYVADLVMLG